MSEYETFESVENLDELVGSTVHIAESGILYCNVIIDKVTTQTIHVEGRSFDRNNSTVYFVYKPMKKYRPGDVVRVVKINGKELTTSVCGTVKGVEQAQGGGDLLHLTISANTPELMEIRENDKANEDYGYFGAGFIVEKHPVDPSMYPSTLTAYGYWK